MRKILRNAFIIFFFVLIAQLQTLHRPPDLIEIYNAVLTALYVVLSEIAYGVWKSTHKPKKLRRKGYFSINIINNNTLFFN
jgi:hypothetical protein